MITMVKQWNEFIEGIRTAEEAWEAFSSHRLKLKEDGRDKEFAYLPLGVQKSLNVTNPHARFEVALGRLMDYWRASGGLSMLVIPKEDINQIIKQEQEKEETEDAR